MYLTVLYYGCESQHVGEWAPRHKSVLFISSLNCALDEVAFIWGVEYYLQV